MDASPTSMYLTTSMVGPTYTVSSGPKGFGKLLSIGQ